MYADIDLSSLTDMISTAIGLKAQNRFFGTADGLDDLTRTVSSETLDQAVEQRINQDVADSVKRRILNAKFRERRPQRTQPGVSDPMELAAETLRDEATAQLLEGKTSVHNLASLTGDHLRFPFQVGQCVFHTGDAVRIFWRDPLNANDWY